MTQNYDCLDRHRGQQTHRAYLALCKPDSKNRAAIDCLPADLAATIVLPGEHPFPKCIHLGAWCPQPSPGLHAAIGIIEQELVKIGPACKCFARTVPRNGSAFN